MRKTIVSPWPSSGLFLGTARSVSPHCSDCALFPHMLDVSLLRVRATLHYPSPAAALFLPSLSRLKLSAGKRVRYHQLSTWSGARSLLYLNRGLGADCLFGEPRAEALLRVNPRGTVLADWVELGETFIPPGYRTVFQLDMSNICSF